MACIYVAIGRDGLLKVGRSADFKRRLSGLRKEFKRFGNEVVSSVRFDLFTEHQAFCAEMCLLDKLKGHLEPYAGREWFTGRPELALLAASVTADEELFQKPRYVHVPLPPAEVERRRAKRLAEREAYARRLEEARVKSLAEIDARRVLREQRRAEIALREAIRFGLIKQESEPA